MRKILALKVTTIFAIAPLMFFVFSPFAAAALYGKATVNYSNSIRVSQNAIFSLAVEGYTDSGRVIKEVAFSSPRSYSGYSSDGNNWYVQNCGSSSTSCSLAWRISESSPGTYTYTGRVTDIDSDTSEAEQAYTNNVIVEVVAAQAPGGTPPAGNASPAGVSQQPCPPGTICLENPLGVSTFDALLNKIIDFIFWVGITIAPVIFIIAGFLFVTSVGDAKKLETAKHMMLYAIIGLAVLLLARGLVAVLKSILGAQ